MNDDKRIQEIKERLNKATPGPWTEIQREEYCSDIDSETANIAMVGSTKADANFIAHAPEDIAYLLSCLEQANRRAEAAEKILHGFAVGSLDFCEECTGKNCATCYYHQENMDSDYMRSGFKWRGPEGE